MNRRRGYLDWLRGIGVLIMIEAHVLDSWTRAADRDRVGYGWATVVGGFGAPIFLFLAGVALALAAGSRVRRGTTPNEAAALAVRRGWQIFGLAFLFRLQSLVVSGGTLAKLVKVDILNVMGVSMVVAGILWARAKRPARKAVWLAGAAIAVAMVTPIIRATPVLEPLPDVIEWYFRAPPGRATFTLFPWAGFVLAGAAIGLWLDGAVTDVAERRVNLALAGTGALTAVLAYAASYLPPLYADTSFWTSSPTFFFLRVGVLMAAIPVAYAVRRAWPGRSRIEELGVSSLFVYWIHVEMVYGLLSLPIHRRLPLELSLLGAAALAVGLFWLVKLKNRLQGGRPKMNNELSSTAGTVNHSLVHGRG